VGPLRTLARCARAAWGPNPMRELRTLARSLSGSSPDGSSRARAAWGRCVGWRAARAPHGAPAPCGSFPMRERTLARSLSGSSPDGSSRARGGSGCRRSAARTERGGGG
jgi:hypothetical protein